LFQDTAVEPTAEGAQAAASSLDRTDLGVDPARRVSTPSLRDSPRPRQEPNAPCRIREVCPLVTNGNRSEGVCPPRWGGPLATGDPSSEGPVAGFRAVVINPSSLATTSACVPLLAAASELQRADDPARRFYAVASVRRLSPRSICRWHSANVLPARSQVRRAEA
jgi:hypothetical protein